MIVDTNFNIIEKNYVDETLGRLILVSESDEAFQEHPELAGKEVYMYIPYTPTELEYYKKLQHDSDINKILGELQNKVSKIFDALNL